MSISDLHNTNALRFFAQFAEQSEIASQHLSHQEIFERDLHFKAARGGTIIDGWLWNICWDAARKYYLEDNSGDNSADAKIDIPQPSEVPHVSPAGIISRKKNRSHVAPYEERETSKEIIEKSKLFDKTEHWPEED